jgi:hypothetical protein
MKTCPKCKTSERTPVNFGPDPRRKDGLRGWCKKCEARKDAQPEYKTRRRAHHFKKQYGLTLREVSGMRWRQGNRCATCLASFVNAPNVDHDHKTGKVRGLLCSPCNRMLGCAYDSPATLSRAALYLEAAGI